MTLLLFACCCFISVADAVSLVAVYATSTTVAAHGSAGIAMGLSLVLVSSLILLPLTWRVIKDIEDLDSGFSFGKTARFIGVLKTAPVFMGVIDKCR